MQGRKEATLCESCFKARAALNGAQSGGNTKNHVVDGSLSLSLSLSRERAPSPSGQQAQQQEDLQTL